MVQTESKSEYIKIDDELKFNNTFLKKKIIKVWNIFTVKIVIQNMLLPL